MFLEYIESSTYWFILVVILNIKAIPAIMGANVGTPITSTLVAFGNVAHPKEFRNAMEKDFIYLYLLSSLG